MVPDPFDMRDVVDMNTPHSGAMLCVKRILASVVCYFDPWIKHFQIKVGECSGRRVFYSITTGRTTEIAEVSRRQPLEYWKIGPKVLANGKLRREQLMLLESMMQGFCPETLNGTDGSTEL